MIIPVYDAKGNKKVQVEVPGISKAEYSDIIRYYNKVLKKEKNPLLSRLLTFTLLKNVLMPTQRIFGGMSFTVITSKNTAIKAGKEPLVLRWK